MSGKSTASTLERERVVNRPRHWVRLATACNSRCLFCLDADTPRHILVPFDEVESELLRGRTELNAERVILSGGEASLHPRYFEIIKRAVELGYDRVQTVTNGWKYAERDFYESAVRAGLGEITFSLQGHTAELHDNLCQHPGSFARISKSILRAVRDPRVIANVDVVINGINIEFIEEIIEYAMRLGVREFDLLHVIPQANAFDNRDRMFYDVRAHLPSLHRVFRLNRHPGVTIWTNRFPIPWLEDLEDLIQDPHKMLDEVNGRRFMVRNYLDTGKPLECRDPERCKHCFIEPFCNTMDDVIEQQHKRGWSVWWVGEQLTDARPIHPGCTSLGVHVPTVADLEAARRTGLDLYAQVDAPGIPSSLEGLTLVATTAAQLDMWFPLNVPLVVHLNQQTAPWILAHRDALSQVPHRLHIHQPSYELLAGATATDIRDPAAFFRRLNLPVLVSGLPACAAPGATLTTAPAILPAHLFNPDTGRILIRELARFHVSERYRAKSVRCQDCSLTAACDGFHINMIRDQGLKLCKPLQSTAPLTPHVVRVGHGRPPLAPAPSLPGHSMPTHEVDDPLAVMAIEFAEKRRARREAREQAMLARADN